MKQGCSISGDSPAVPFDFERRFPPGGEISDLRPRLSANRIIDTLPAGRSNHRLPWRPTTKSKLTSPHHCNVMERSIRLQQPEQQKAALERHTFELQRQRIRRKPSQFHTCLNQARPGSKICRRCYSNKQLVARQELLFNQGCPGFHRQSTDTVRRHSEFPDLSNWILTNFNYVVTHWKHSRSRRLRIIGWVNGVDLNRVAQLDG